MIAKRLAFAFVSILFGVSTADAQKRSSGWEPDTPMHFERSLGPSTHVDTPEACRASCMNDKRCTAWTYYHPEFTGAGPRETWEPLRGTCVMGTGFRARMPHKASGLTSGMVREVWECQGRPGVSPDQYTC